MHGQRHTPRPKSCGAGKSGSEELSSGDLKINSGHAETPINGRSSSGGHFVAYSGPRSGDVHEPADRYDGIVNSAPVLPLGTEVTPAGTKVPKARRSEEQESRTESKTLAAQLVN